MTPLPDSAASSLGQYLQQIRKSKNLEIEQISAETRISKSTLAAIEADDFSHLPADAFARGLYALYAKTLGINSEEIIAWFNQIRRKNTSEIQHLSSPLLGSQQTYSAPKAAFLAESQRISPLATFLIFLAVLFVLTICGFWYFHVNPVTLLREKIHLVQTKSPSPTTVTTAKAAIHSQKNSEAVEHKTKEETIPPPSGTTNPPHEAAQPAESAVTPAPPPAHAATGAKHILQAEFIEITRVSSKIDKEKRVVQVFQPGTTYEWQADSLISLRMYGKANVRLTFDGQPVAMPGKDGRVELIFPQTNN